MSIDERELRSRLAESAALAGPPRFTTEDLAPRVRRIRRRRRSRAGIIAAVSAVAVASAAAIPLALGGTSQPVISAPPPPAPGLSYTVTVNGQTRAVPATGAELSLFTITPGENLRIKVGVTVPAHVRVTALWLGISKGSWGTGPNGPTGINYPILAHTSKPLGPGSYRFRLRWTVPAGLRPGTSRYLATAWVFREAPTGAVARAIADFAVPLPSGATSPPPILGQTRAWVLPSTTGRS